MLPNLAEFREAFKGLELFCISWPLKRAMCNAQVERIVLSYQKTCRVRNDGGTQSQGG